jgi:hypothetical protein
MEEAMEAWRHRWNVLGFQFLSQSTQWEEKAVDGERPNEASVVQSL